MHESPGISVAFSVQNLVDAVTDLSFWCTFESISLPATAATSLWLSRWAHDDALIAAADVMPGVLLFLSKNVTERVNGLVNIFNPVDHNGDSSDTWVFVFLLENGLAC